MAKLIQCLGFKNKIKLKKKKKKRKLSENFISLRIVTRPKLVLFDTEQVNKSGGRVSRQEIETLFRKLGIREDGG